MMVNEVSVQMLTSYIIKQKFQGDVSFLTKYSRADRRPKVLSFRT